MSEEPLSICKYARFKAQIQQLLNNKFRLDLKPSSLVHLWFLPLSTSLIFLMDLFEEKKRD